MSKDMEIESGEFHSQGGWCFKRLADGSVRLRKWILNRGNYFIVEEEIFDPNIWASIISFVRNKSVENLSHEEAERFHNSP